MDGLSSPFSLTTNPSLGDLSDIVNWHLPPEKIRLVCAEQVDHLTTDLLQKWMARGHETLVLRHEDDGISAFAVLTQSEVPDCPDDYIELCHLMINPKRRHQRDAGRLIQIAAAHAKAAGFAYLMGRCCPENKWALRINQRLSEEFTAPWLPTGFHWFRISCKVK